MRRLSSKLGFVLALFLASAGPSLAVSAGGHFSANESCGRTQRRRAAR